MIHQRKMYLLWLAAIVTLSLILAPMQGWAAQPPVKNVIILMMDGTASSHVTLSRWYKGSPLALDSILVGGVRTYSADSLITDSAPAATAFATGYKTNSKFLGIMPEITSTPGVTAITEDLKFKPVASVMEGAKLQGKSIGLIATSNIQHASPAGYSAHTPFRDAYTLIATQQVYENIDVVFSGGKKYLLPTDQGGVRLDGENLIQVLKDRGYAFVETQNEMLKITNSKVWGLFAADAMQYEFDRKELTPNEPSLAEMTKKAIELLSKNEKGFFLFVEGSKIDWAAHANDPVGVISDVLAFDDAVKTALDFASRDGQTLIMAFADHGTGGMSIGAKSVAKTYDRTPFAAVIPPLKQAQVTGEGLDQIIGDDRTEWNIRQKIAQFYGIEELTADEVKLIQKAPRGRAFANVVGPMLSQRAAIGWVYTGHTGDDLFLYAFGPNRPTGLIENTKIAQICAQSMGFDLNKVSDELFVDLSKYSTSVGATLRIDNADPNIITIYIDKGLKSAQLPAGKNLLLLGNNTYSLPGIVVYISKTGKAYAPRKAIDLIASYVQ